MPQPSTPEAQPPPPGRTATAARLACVLALLLPVLAGLPPPVAAAGATRSAVLERWPGWSVDAFEQIDSGQGLPNEVSIAVAEDRAGFIWVGTMGGVARWDGHEFRAQRFDAGAPGSLPDNVVQVMHRDTQGRLWVGTSGGGLLRLDGAGPGPAHLSTAQGLAHVSVRALADDGAGGLWVGSDGGLDRVDGQTGSVHREPMTADSANGLRGQGAVAVLRDRRGRLWVGTTLGLFVRDSEGGAFRELRLQPPASRSGEPPLPTRPESLLEDSQGRIWIGTNRHGAFVIDSDGATARQVQETGLPAGAKSVTSRRVMALVEATPGEVWLGTLGQGVVAIDAASGRTRRLMHRPLLPASLPDNQVRGLFRDRAGLVWVATYAGVARIDPRATALSAVSAAAAEPDLVRTRADYSSLLAHSSGRIWMGTLSQGLHIVDPRNGALQSLRTDSQRPAHALPPDALVALAEALDGSVFVASHRGLYRVRTAPGREAGAAGGGADAARVERVTWPGRPAETATGALLPDGQRLWIGGLTDGLWDMDMASGRVRAAITDPVRQLSDRRITALARGRQGELWIGTRNGLNRFDPVSGQVQVVAAGDPALGRLGSGFIASLLVDRAGRLWVATYGGGLHLLQGDGRGETLRFLRVATAQGLPDDNVNSVIEDEAGRLWVSTDSGLAVVDAEKLSARALRRAEGALYASYWTNSVARTAFGELLFGASGGLTVVRPALLQGWNYRPPVVLTELRIGGQPVALPMSAAAQALQVPAEANSLSAEYAALDYSAPARNRYAHRLQGFDSDWIYTDARRRVANYAQLPPGEYRLQLRGSNRDGVFSEEMLSLPIHVAAAWHQTWWFRALAALLALLLLSAVVHRRTRVLQARRSELERLVDERTTELMSVSQALTEKSRALEEKSRVLELASISDPLTGLHNRRFLTEHIEATLAACQRRAAVVPPRAGLPVDTDTLFFLIDVDQFKRVNDEFGHAAGDAVLVQLAQRLKVVMRDSDDIVRWGGEEFLAVAHDTDRARADELAERIRSDVAGSDFVLADGRTLTLSCSIGHAAWPFMRQHPQALDWQAVVNLADMGLLAAKRLGRNTWVGVHAGPAAKPQGLPMRSTSAPQQALRDCEICITSSHAALAAVASALAPD